MFVEDFMYNTLGFTDKQTRDEEWAKMKAAGTRGVVRYTTHDQNHPQIIYVLAYPVVEKTQLSTKTEVPLTEAIASGMLDEGGNTNEQTHIRSEKTPTAIPDADPASL
jgi:hypothetical protein